MPQLKEFRVNLGLSINAFADLSGLPYGTIKRAEQGSPIRPQTAVRLAEVLSKVTGRKMKPTDIEGLNIK